MAEQTPQKIQVGSRVEVADSGLGWAEVDNEDGTWDVFLDDGTDGTFQKSQLHLCADQSLEKLVEPSTDTVLKLPSGGARIVKDPGTEPKPDGWTRFVCFSDTHGRHNEINQRNCPVADVLLHGGDFTNTGEEEQVDSLNTWLKAYPASHKIVIAGNHDITFHEDYYTTRGAGRFHRQVTSENTLEVAAYDCEKVRALLKDCIYLEDSCTEVCGYLIYGSPWQPEFCDWAFNLPRGEPLREKWSQIPECVDILLTHGPAKGHCDHTSRGNRVGCEELLAAIEEREVSVHVSGHIHEGYGCSSDDVTLYINASTCTHQYKPTNPPIVFDLPPPSSLRSATQKAAADRRR